MSKFTGGNWAVSPIKISLHPIPSYTYSIKSSRSDLFPNPLSEDSGIIDASSTIKIVLEWVFSFSLIYVFPLLLLLIQ